MHRLAQTVAVGAAALAACCVLGSALADTGSAEMLTVRAGTFESVLPPAPSVKSVTVAPFLIDRT